MANRRLEERRTQFKQYKEDVDKRGKPFYPWAMFADTVMSTIVVSVIIGLAVIWKYSVPGEEGTPDYGTEPGLLGPLYSEKADPGTTSFIPRPDWYFYFLFYLLRIFKWPESVILATVGIPTILLILLIALPFLDLRRERRILRRPVAVVAGILVVVSMGILTYKGATAEEALGASSEVVDLFITENNLPEDVRPGAELVAESGCLTCHTYSGVGSPNLGAPDLTTIGAGGQGADFFSRYVANPRDFGNNVMPVYGAQAGGALTDEQLKAIGEFLAASQGAGG
jgi:cytochrome c5